MSYNINRLWGVHVGGIVERAIREMNCVCLCGERYYVFVCLYCETERNLIWDGFVGLKLHSNITKFQYKATELYV